MQTIDFLATQAHYIDHIAPVWDALADDNIGNFYVPHNLLGHAQNKLKHHFYLFGYEDNSPETFGVNPILVAAYGDMKYAHRINPERPIFMMEHGTGHTFGGAAWPNGKGDRDLVSLFLSPNLYTVKKIQQVRNTPCEVIGTPKLDWVTKIPTGTNNSHPVVCIAFHHGTRRRNPPEAGSAWEHYRDTIPELKKRFNLAAHAHPLSRERDIPYYKAMGVPYIETLEEVMQVADIMVNDLSSAMYEFLTTGKPVVIMNAPWFRKDVEHGIRFWDYSDFGPHVWEPKDLPDAINQVLHDPDSYAQERARTVVDLFPYLGFSAKRAAGVIRQYLKEEERVQSDW